MERVTSRPVSISNIRQRILTNPDTEFKTRKGRYNRTSSKLDMIDNLFGEIRLRELPHLSQSVSDATLALNSVATEPNRTLSNKAAPQPSATFSYDGVDLTGVVRRRVLNTHHFTCRMKREHSTVMTLKRHIRKVEEQRRRNQRSGSVLLTVTAPNRLDSRRESRDSRNRPWTEKPPERSSRDFVAERRASIKPTSAPLVKPVVIGAENMWLSERADELMAIERTVGFEPITVVVVSSVLRHSTADEVLMCLHDEKWFIRIVYDFFSHKYKNIVQSIETELDKLGQGLKIERLVLLCQGGSGFLLPFETQVINKDTLKESPETRRFWDDLGSKMSKRDVSKTSIYIGGFDVLSSQGGRELLFEIKNALFPHKLTVNALPSPAQMTLSQRSLISTIFIHPDEYKTILSARKTCSRADTSASKEPRESPSLDRISPALKET